MNNTQNKEREVKRKKKRHFLPMPNGSQGNFHGTTWKDDIPFTTKYPVSPWEALLGLQTADFEVKCKHHCAKAKAT